MKGGLSGRMGELAELSQDLEKLLRLETSVLGMRRLEKADDLKEIGCRMAEPTLFCQQLTVARRRAWTIGDTSRHMHWDCAQHIGIRPVPEGYDAGYKAEMWFESADDARKQGKAMRMIPYDGRRAVVIGPLSREKFEPEVIIVYGKPTQMIMLVCALQFKDYQRFQFFCIGESSGCTDSIAECYVTGKPALAVPSYGEIILGHAHEDELVMTLAPSDLEKAVNGLHGLSQKGIRYPATYLGAANPIPGLQEVYKGVPDSWSEPWE